MALPNANQMSWDLFGEAESAAAERERADGARWPGRRQERLMSEIYTDTVRRYFTEHRPGRWPRRRWGPRRRWSTFSGSWERRSRSRCSRARTRSPGPPRGGELSPARGSAADGPGADPGDRPWQTCSIAHPPENDDEDSSPRGRELLQMTRESTQENARLTEQPDRELHEEMATQHQ